MSDTQWNQSRGVAYFAKLNYENPDKGYEGNRPNLQLCFVPDDPKEFTKEGLELKDATEKIPEKHVKITTKFVERPLRVVDAKGNSLPHTFIVGNGSVVNVQWSPNDYGRGVSAMLNGVQIIELVEFEPDDSASFSEAEGFEYNPASDASSASDESARANDGL